MFTISKLAQACGVSVEAIRFYQRKNLVRQPARLQGSIRYYDEIDVKRLRFIKMAQSVGFSLKEVQQLLLLEEGTQCEEARIIAEHKLADIQAKKNDLIKIESLLAGLIEQCEKTNNQAQCPIITSFQEG